ncbi:hypothetical protein F4604DRAFT_1941885 [Suillus subluteus]|nr:hypothetical protein F4604DRAFT_1941885 [Suillus subluteus]
MITRKVITAPASYGPRIYAESASITDANDDGRKSWTGHHPKSRQERKKFLHPMELPSSPSSTITAPLDCHEICQRSGKLIAEAMTCRFALLHYDRASRSMVEWCWPADDEGKKIPPSDFEKSREKYDFRYPCCLCADDDGKEAYVEAAVYPWWNTTTKKTHWTVRCASDTCGYRVNIDVRHFQLAPLAALQYPQREGKISPVQLEWTIREQTELLNRLASSVGDGIALNRVYPGDLWEIVGERTIEVKQEEVLLQHQSLCVGGLKGKRHVIVEHLLMEERKKRGQMEVSLYSQAIEHLQQHRMRMRDMRTFSTTPRCAVTCASLACATSTQNKCESWLRGSYGYHFRGESFMEMCSFVDGAALSRPGLAISHEDKRASVILNCVGPSLPLLSTWVSVDVQEAFYHAFHAEQAFQARLTTYSLHHNGDHVYQHNIELESLTLQAKMHRAQAEIDLYTMAIANACEFDFSHNISTSPPSDGFIPPPQPDELCYYSEDHDSYDDDSFDFEVE